MTGDNKIRIKFEYTDTNGDTYSQESRFEVFHDLGVTEIESIGEQLNTFLKLIGYIRDNDYIFMDDVTEEEMNAIASFLSDYRANNGGVI